MSFLNMNPGINIFGFHVAWYGVIIAFSMFAAIIIAMKVSKYRGLINDDILGVALCVIPLCIIGARVYFVLFSGRSYTLVEFLQVWNGGMAIYGGIAGGALGALIYCLIKKKNFLDFADVLAPCLILGQAIGRWGNFVNQEAHGIAVSNPALQWFPFSVYIDKCVESSCDCLGSGWHLATFFYESLWNFIVFFILMVILVKVKKSGIVTGAYFVLYGIGRTFIEGLRTDSLYVYGTSIRVSQLVSVVLVLVGIAMVVYFGIKERNDRKTKNVKS